MKINTPSESLLVILLFLAMLHTSSPVFAAPPPPPLNPPPDPFPNDLHPYPPTDATLYYVRDIGYLIGDFTIDIGMGTVSLELVPKNLEDFAIGYFTEFSPTMTVSIPLQEAMNQKFVGLNNEIHLWPRWFNDASHGYDEGEEVNYWPGWRFYYEDLDWESSGWDHDIDDLWIDIGWQKIGGGVWILVKTSCNEALSANPFEITFVRESGNVPVFFSYSLNEKASGGGITTGTFVLGDDPITIQAFGIADVWDWGQFYGTVPVLPSLAFPVAVCTSVLILRKRRGHF